MNAQLNKRLHAIITKNGLVEQKSDLINGVTQGRSTSSKDLTDTEALNLIEKLEAQYPLSKAIAKIDNKQLNKAFFLFRKIGFTTLSDKLDYTRIDAFCLAKSKAKKKLTDMDSKELTDLIYKLDAIIKKK